MVAGISFREKNVSATDPRLKWREDLNAEVAWEGAFGTKVWHVDIIAVWSTGPEVYPGHEYSVADAYRKCAQQCAKGNTKAMAAVLMCDTDKALQEYVAAEKT